MGGFPGADEGDDWSTADTGGDWHPGTDTGGWDDPDFGGVDTGWDTGGDDDVIVAADEVTPPPDPAPGVWLGLGGNSAHTGQSTLLGAAAGVEWTTLMLPVATSDCRIAPLASGAGGLLVVNTPNRMAVLDPQTGAIVASLTLAEDEPAAYSAAIAESGRIYRAGRGLRGFYHFGKPIWHFREQALAGAAPTVYGEVVFAGFKREQDNPERAGVYAVSPEGDELWWADTHDVDGAAPAIASGGDVVVGCGQGHVHRLAVNTGGHQWLYEAAAPIRVAPVVTEAGDIVIVDDNGTMTVLSAAGAPLWSHSLGVVAAPVVTHDDAIMVGAADGERRVFDVAGALLHTEALGPWTGRAAVGADDTAYVTMQGKTGALEVFGERLWVAAWPQDVCTDPIIGADGSITVATNDALVILGEPVWPDPQ